ncbi:sarcoplasmic reticulum histidine-rich calcium-binding protein-like [Pecten maximus]|uniref:sarcoplasmic reticulum histidine-rich calcium-binding protein-like n=1 Tax=Pecten maximus TaxID=6579 RepID=UPI001457EE76|nr:sarcoplasmic reticulum histidine-rich calcium-binding protein-like [Pecten maximus]
MKATYMLAALSVLILVIFVNAADEEQKEKKLDPETLDYAKGSVCGYCEYCQFCELCDSDCPCETSPSQPNCKMCKYCKFCYLCSAVCDTVCKPGGILDKVSSAIVSALPIHDKEEIDKDLDSVSDWIAKEKRDEL